MKFIHKNMAVAILAAALCCSFASPGEAAPRGPNAPQGNFGGPEFGYGNGLSPEQMEQARQIFNESYASMDSTRQNLAAKRAELNAELANPNPDKAKIERLATEIGALRGKMLAARTEVRSRLQEQGLPADYYGPRGPNPYYDGPRPGWGCPGMGMMEDGYRGWHDGYGWGHHGPRHGRRGCGW